MLIRLQDIHKPADYTYIQCFISWHHYCRTELLFLWCTKGIINEEFFMICELSVTKNYLLITLSGSAKRAFRNLVLVFSWIRYFFNFFGKKWIQAFPDIEKAFNNIVPYNTAKKKKSSGNAFRNFVKEITIWKFFYENFKLWL